MGLEPVGVVLSGRVLGVGDRLEVGWVAASTVPAEVVEL